jgi:maleate cis-trans isomerase
VYTKYSHYGWRARIGLIAPSLNVVMEPELSRMMPEGVSIHTTRVLLQGKATAESYLAMAEATSRAATELGMTDPDAIAYGCTSGSIIEGEEGITRRIQGAAGNVPVVTTAGAVLQALRALGLRRVAVATPYLEFVNREEKEYLESNGFEVTRILGLEMGHDEAERKMIGRQPPGIAYRIGREACTPDADGLFISCTNFATLPIIEQLEEELGKPVVTSNQATAWASLRQAGIGDRLEGAGRLLREA